MDKHLFFSVWGIPELRELIKSFMWPGQLYANYYEYNSADAALINGYLVLFDERKKHLVHEYDGHLPLVIAHAIRKGNLGLLKMAHTLTEVANPAQELIMAARYDRCDIIMWLREAVSAIGAIAALDWAAYGESDFYQFVVAQFEDDPVIQAIQMAKRYGNQNAFDLLYPREHEQLDIIELLLDRVIALPSSMRN